MVAKAACSPAGSAPSITICSPVNGSTIGSPVHVSAFANSSRSIEAVQIYVDGNLLFKTTSPSVETDLSLSQGSHTLLLKLWTATGLNASASVGVNVSGAAPPPPPGP